MPDQLFTQYVVSPFVILSTSHEDCVDNGCLGRGEYLDIDRAGAQGMEERVNAMSREVFEAWGF
jgi:hypothetical protein